MRPRVHFLLPLAEAMATSADSLMALFLSCKLMLLYETADSRKPRSRCLRKARSNDFVACMVVFGREEYSVLKACFAYMERDDRDRG